MNSLKFLVVFTLVTLSFAEPPRRRLNFRAFGRQEVEDDEKSGNKPAEGYKYEQPQGERLRLPSRFTSFTKFGRQEEKAEKPSEGYHYPKPDNGYGPPAEETTKQPDGGYGTPNEDDSTPSDIDITTTDAPAALSTTDNPQAERLRSFNRKNGNSKLQRLQKTVKIQPKSLKIVQQEQIQLQQPVVYFVNPVAADFVQQPQFEYFYVLNK